MPLILDIVENIGTKKVFTKMNLRWGYNNVWIKEGDKLKVVFMTTEELFELMVMFLGLTNSPAIFQTMMNEILWDLINTSKVASFINNVIVGTEEEKRYNKMVEEVVKRLMENDLYMQVKGEGSRILRSSNQIWGIKMEEEKVKGVLD